MTNIRSFSTKPSVFDDYQAELLVNSPGRINLIGEHTDYNEGFAMPTAIDKQISFKFRINETENFCRIYSDTFNNGFEFHLDQPLKKQSDWRDYLLGIIHELQQKNKLLEGFDCMISSDLPTGAGISSSAALQCGFCAGLNELFALNLSDIEIAKISQCAENEFVGSNCGIMDQFASVLSKKDHFIKLDCRSLATEYIAADLGNFELLLLNTRVSHNLTDSDYNSRREECEEAIRLIQLKNPEIKSLRDVDFDLLESYRSELSEITYQRCLYVLQENERVQAAADALRNNDLQALGKLMYASHRGLQCQYEVSCQELDFLVNFAEEKEFIYGSRMMGGGFGGCTINLINSEDVESYITEISEAYFERFKIYPEAIKVAPSAGTEIIKLVSHE
ncbi:galactokinase [uncultured Christiangramia sp.]|uniref:galactokinase n=1 Tax=uncultured Christiangramia sp. TaxID=503836 RepID=UPI00261E9704|nr:galactokinase [uncultured Christiangramia sp.]